MSSADTAPIREKADIVIVGTRVAGASLAAHLAAQGREVVVVDRARFPSDTLSTHLIQVSGVRSMQKLGVLERLTETGAPFLTGASVSYDGTDLSADVRAEEGWPPGGISVNRNQLDKILMDAADEAGARVYTGTSLIGVGRDDSGRATRLLVRGPEGVRVIETSLTVGADGRNSRLSGLVGARTYNTTPNERFVYWADYEGVEEPGPAVVHHHREGNRLTVAFASDRGYFTVLVCPDLSGFGTFKRTLPESFDEAVHRCVPLRPLLARARRASRPIGTAYLPGYFRESSGLGWALIGDAGHFKDPALGQGISDAFRQSEVFAEYMSRVSLDDAEAVDRATRAWSRWRDRDAMAMYWLGWDFARSGELGGLERSLMRQIAKSPFLKERFIDGVLSHRVSPYEVLRPGLFLRVAYEMGLRGASWTNVASQVCRRIGTEVERRWVLFRPRYGPLPKPAGGAASKVQPTGQTRAGDVVGKKGGAEPRATRSRESRNTTLHPGGRGQSVSATGPVYEQPETSKEGGTP